MASVEKQVRSLFGKLDHQLTKLAAKPSPTSVHRFRTSGRRLEVALTELAPAPSRSTRKLLKLLSRLRKKAGRVRDLDVQITLLRGLKMPEGARHKSQLLHALLEDRAQREKKVMQAFDRETVRELRKRLKRTAAHFQIDENAAWTQARNLVTKLELQSEPLTEKVLHRYRIAGKRARYLAELSDANPESQLLVDELKRMQDALGEWHDWLKLTQRAENLFGGAPGSPLVSALRNLTRARFRFAALALTEARSALSSKKPAELDRTLHRPQPAPVSATAAAA